MDFRRQPEKVIVIIEGEPEDVAYWQRELERRAEFKGDSVQRLEEGHFAIHPRAVNE